MARRWKGNMNGEQFLGNSSSSKMEVHDLDREKPQCQIDEIIRAGNDRPFETLQEAKAAGFDNGHWCIGDSER